MRNLQEQNLNSDDISFLRDNIPFVSRNIHESFLQNIKNKTIEGIKGIARYAGQLGKQAASAVISDLISGKETGAHEASNYDHKLALEHLARHVQMHPTEVHRLMSRIPEFRDPNDPSKFIPPTLPKRPTNFQREQHQDNMKDYVRIVDLHARHSLLRDRDPRYRELTQTVEDNQRRSAELAQGSLMKFYKSTRDKLNAPPSQNP